MKRFLLLLAVVIFSSCPVLSQTTVQTIPVSTRQRVFTAAVAPQTFTVRNIGQTCHVLTYSAAFPLRLTLEASSDGSTWRAISYTSISTSGALYATGYFPVVRVNFSETDGGAGQSLTADYVGTSSCNPPIGNGVDISLNKFRKLFLAQPAGGNLTASGFLPYAANTAGVIVWTNGGGLPAATCLLQISATTGSASAVIYSRALPQANGDYIFPVPAFPADTVSVTFTACGATASSIDATYLFFDLQMVTKYAGGSPVLSSSTPVEGDFNCTQSAPISFTAGGAGSTQIVALGTSQVIRVCHVSFAGTVAVNAKLVYGTGANCVTAPADVTGPYQNVLSLALDFGSAGALRTPAGQALCLNVSGAVTVGGVVSYAQF